MNGPGAAAIVAALLALGAPAQAASAPVAVSTESTTIQLVEYFLKVDLADANPRLVPDFLAVNAETLPKKLRDKALAKQIEIKALIKLHDTKKSGLLVQPVEGCSEKDFVVPLDQAGFYARLGYEEITEDELKFVSDQTKCDEVDLGCRFTLKIFFKKKKDRRLMLYQTDPIMSIVAASRGKGAGNSRFFGNGLTCMH